MSPHGVLEDPEKEPWKWSPLPQRHPQAIAHMRESLRNGCVRQEEEEGELVKNFVGAMYNDGKHMLPRTQSRVQNAMDMGDRLERLRIARGCLEQVCAHTIGSNICRGWCCMAPC